MGGREEWHLECTMRTVPSLLRRHGLTTRVQPSSESGSGRRVGTGLEGAARRKLYADDAVIFINPTVDDVRNTKKLLDKFGNVTGLNTNI